MIPIRHDVLGIGNAIVDVLSQCEEDFLVRQGMIKGGMALIDEGRAEDIYNAMGPCVEISGGSAANTMAGIASFGGRAAFIGRVRADALGQVFTHDIRASGVSYSLPAVQHGPATARSYILVTPDGERTMNTYLGAAQLLSPDDIHAEEIASSSILYMEGYLWDPPGAKAAFLKAASIAHDAGRMVALTLSDSFCVDRYRDEFLGLLRDGVVDLVFANESELHSLYQTADFDTALSALRLDARLAVVTRSEKGALVVSRDNTHAVPAVSVERVIDTTGAGDLFAAGFLFGFARGMGYVDCARLGALAAAEIISHIGARPEVRLGQLAVEQGVMAA